MEGRALQDFAESATTMGWSTASWYILYGTVHVQYQAKKLTIGGYAIRRFSFRFGCWSASIQTHTVRRARFPKLANRRQQTHMSRTAIRGFRSQMQVALRLY